MPQKFSSERMIRDLEKLHAVLAKLAELGHELAYRGVVGDLPAECATLDAEKIQELVDLIDLGLSQVKLGGGAFLYCYGPNFRSMTVCDKNAELINLYRVVQTRVRDLITELQESDYFYIHKSDPVTLANYKRIRAWTPTDPVERAARFRFLMKTCFNGLSRVNRRGEFNVAPGSYRKPKICDPDLLLAHSAFLQQVRILPPMSAAKVIQRVPHPSVFWFVNPPYDSPHHDKFVDFAGKFDADDQLELVEALVQSPSPFIYTNRLTWYVHSFFHNIPKIRLNVRPLQHHVQPVRCSGKLQQELIAYRL